MHLPALGPQISFTGHSLGGSLGTVLMLMYVRRGVLPISAVSPVYTFGAPAVFCEGSAGGGSCACRAGSSGSAGGCGGVLQALGLPEGAVRCAGVVQRARLVQCVSASCPVVCTHLTARNRTSLPACLPNPSYLSLLPPPKTGMC